MPHVAPHGGTSWTMPALLRASVGLHACAAGVALAAPHAAWYALGAVVLDHAAITAAGLLPRCGWLGPNITRLGETSAQWGEVALTIDDGPDPQVTPQVLDTLEAHGLRASFFCIAEKARRHPALVREIAARGHSVQNHSDHHPLGFATLGPRRMRAEIERAQETLAQLTRERPLFFRAPAGLRNPFLDPALHRLGLQLVSWTRRAYDTREGRPQRVLERLCRGLAGGDILLLHDGNAARSPDGRPVILEVLPLLAQRMQALGLHAVTLPQALQPRRSAFA